MSESDDTVDARRKAAEFLIDEALEAHESGDIDRGLSLCETLIATFGEDDDEEVCASVAWARYTSAAALQQAGRHEEALDRFVDVIDRYAGVGRPFAKYVRLAYWGRQAALRDLGRREEEIEVCDEIVERYGQAERKKARALVMRALRAKGNALSAVGEPRAAEVAFDEAIARCAPTDPLELRQLAVKAAFDKAAAAMEQRAWETAAGAYDSCLSMLSPGEDDERFEQALTWKAGALCWAGRLDEGLVVARAALPQLRKLDEPECHTGRALAAVSRALHLHGRTQDAVDIAQAIVETFDGVDVPEARRVVAIGVEQPLRHAQRAWRHERGHGSSGAAAGRLRA